LITAWTLSIFISKPLCGISTDGPPITYDRNWSACLFVNSFQLERWGAIFGNYFEIQTMNQEKAEPLPTQLEFPHIVDPGLNWLD